MNLITLKLHGKIFIPNGYTTQWPKKGKKEEASIPSINGVPIIPSAQIKGSLRRAAVRAIVEKSGKRIPDVASYYFNAVGGAKGKKTATNESSTEGDSEDKSKDKKNKQEGFALSDLQLFREKNPICGLFGGTDVIPNMNFYAGHIYVSNAKPEGDLVRGIFGGTRADDSYRDPEGMIKLISGEALDADVAEMHRINRLRTSIKKEVSEIKTKLVKEKATLDADAKKALSDQVREKEKILNNFSGQNSVSMPLSGFPYVIAPSFVTGITLKDVTLVELGLLLAAMEEQMLTNPYLGAHRSSGFGEFSAYWECAQGSISLRPYEPAVIQGDLFHSAVKAFEDALDSFDLRKGDSNDNED